MGRFEDLLEKARNGDTSALDDLASEFGASTLRDKAAKADALEKKVAENKELAIEGQIGRLRSQLPEELRDMDLSAGDFGDVDNPEELTIERLTEKAELKSNTKSKALEAQAKELGFDSVEDLQTALDTAKQAQAKRTEGMEKVTGAASGGGAPPNNAEPDEPFEAMKAVHTDAKTRGLADDRAMGEGVEALLAAQAPAEE